MTPRRGFQRQARKPIRSRAAYYRALRCGLGIRAADVARVSGFSLSYLSAIERGDRPLLPHVEDALGVAIEREQRRVYSAAASADVA